MWFQTLTGHIVHAGLYMIKHLIEIKVSNMRRCGLQLVSAPFIQGIDGYSMIERTFSCGNSDEVHEADLWRGYHLDHRGCCRCDLRFLHDLNTSK